MRDCERNYSMWTFSGGFRTWVKMSLVRTSGKKSESVEFRQEVFLTSQCTHTSRCAADDCSAADYLCPVLQSAVVKFNDKRPESERSNQLFFAVFEWRDAFTQEIRLVRCFLLLHLLLSSVMRSVISVSQLCFHLQIVTANPWSSVAILCGVFMALFKVANFAKLAIRWTIRMRKRHLRNKTRELNQVTNN